MQHFKTKLLLFAFAIIVNYSNAAVQITAYPNSTYLCTGAVGGIYTVNTPALHDLVSLDRLVWNCGALGKFQNSNTTTYEESLNSNNVFTAIEQINWNGSNGQTSWLTATWYYSTIFGRYTVTATYTVYFGIQGSNPTTISYTASPCINSTTPIQVTCPTPLPTVPSGCTYAWTTNNGSISGTGQTVTLTPGANANNIVATVRFYNPNCNSYSAGYSITIPRTTSVPPAPTNAWFDVTFDDGLHCFNSAFVQTVPGATSYLWSSPSIIETLDNQNPAKLNGGRAYTIKVQSKNSCGANLTVYTYTGNTLTCSRSARMNNSGIEATDETTDISLYPNPANASFEVSLPKHEHPVRIVVTNVEGQVVRDFSTSESKAIVESSTMPAGLYIINISSDEMNKISKIQIVR
jgi:hypothetical protein